MSFRENFNPRKPFSMPSSGQFPRNGGTSSFRNFGESRFSDKPDFSGLNDINNILPPVSFENAPPFRKNFYNPPAQPKTKDENERILSKFEITTSGRDANSYQPIENFSDIGFPEYINSELQRQGFTHPTGIQAAAFPIAMSGRNIIGIAKTGSGKTLSYLIPALIHLNDQKTTGWKAEGPIALVLAPTRELAQQIQSVANEFGTRNNITNACIFGGAPKSGQTRQLSRNVDIVIATPGRLIDFLQRDVTNLKRCTYLVLDEADRMLDMGFLPQIKKIMSQIRPDRQVLMFSATWPKEMQLLARDYITDYVQLNIGTTNYAANNNIQQIVDICEENEKDEKLMRILSDISNQNSRKTIIFVETKRRADEITKSVNKRGFNAVSIHGDKSQAERELSLSSFRHGRMRVEILVATDVASRGLDVDDVKFVINYDYPITSQDYIHRIGRTGRCSQTGTAFTFFTKKNSAKAADLIKVLTDSNQVINPMLYEMTGNRGFLNNNKRKPGNNGMMMRKIGGYGRDHGTSPMDQNRGSYNSNIGVKRHWNESKDSSQPPMKRSYPSYEQHKPKTPAPLFATNPTYATTTSFASPPPPPSYATQQSSLYSNFPTMQVPPQAYMYAAPPTATAPPSNIQSFLSYPPPPIVPK